MSRFSRAAIPVAIAVALSTGAAAVSVPTNAEPVASNTATGNAFTTNPTVEQREVLIAQALIEMINEYRVTHGVAPLRTHDLYNENAKKYSEYLATAVPEDEENFQHSDKDEWGWSGENIAFWGEENTDPAFQSPQTSDRPSAVGNVAKQLFTQWHQSDDGHNENMLSPVYQGIGIGVTFDKEGSAHACSMFFIEKTILEGNSYFPGDETTESAKKSGKPFYVGAGARKALGLENWQAPSDRRGANTSYENLEAVFAEEVTDKDGNTVTVERPAKVSIKDGKAGQEKLTSKLEHRADIRIALFVSDPTTKPMPSTTSAPISTATPTTTVAQPEPTPVVTTASSTSENPSTSATPTTTSATSKASPTTATSTTNTKPTTETKPTTKETKPTTSKQSTTKQAPAPAPTPSDGGSSTGQIIGIVLGVLALIVGLVGVGAVATGMVKLPF